MPWDEMGDVDASAELNVSGMPQDDPRSPGWIQIRLWNVTEGVVAIEGRRRDTMNPETMTLTIPRSNRRTNYRVELRTQPGTSGNVFGAITLARRR